MKDYYDYFGCSKGCDWAVSPVHTHHETEGCEIVCVHCGAPYTYSYEEMQDNYFWALCDFEEGVYCEQDQFYRHFEAVKQFAADKERERIIKLLENLDCSANGIEHDCNPLDGYTISELIDLIKGEQK